VLFRDNDFDVPPTVGKTSEKMDRRDPFAGGIISARRHGREIGRRTVATIDPIVIPAPGSA
jgi:hypothetical protein